MVWYGADDRCYACGKINCGPDCPRIGENNRRDPSLRRGGRERDRDGEAYDQDAAEAAYADEQAELATAKDVAERLRRVFTYCDGRMGAESNRVGLNGVFTAKELKAIALLLCDDPQFINDILRD